MPGVAIHLLDRCRSRHFRRTCAQPAIQARRPAPPCLLDRPSPVACATAVAPRAAVAHATGEGRTSRHGPCSIGRIPERSFRSRVPEDARRVPRFKERARFFEPPPRRRVRRVGRPRKRGVRLRSPEQIERDRGTRWRRIRVRIYSRRVQLEVFEQRGLWYSVDTDRLCRMIVTRDPRMGREPSSRRSFKRARPASSSATPGGG